MDKNKIKYVLIAVVILVIAIGIANKFSSNSNENVKKKTDKATNLLEMTVDERKEVAREIAKAVIKNDIGGSSKVKSYLLESECYYDLIRYANSSKLSEGNVSEIVTDYISVENSSTKDDVIMCNAKIF